MSSHKSSPIGRERYRLWIVSRARVHLGVIRWDGTIGSSDFSEISDPDKLINSEIEMCSAKLKPELDY